METKLVFIHTVDHSRVILHDRDPNVIGSDYVNANFVGVSKIIMELWPKWSTIIIGTQESLFSGFSLVFSATGMAPFQTGKAIG